MDIKIEYLSGNGSYDSEECIALLQEADIVVTNPPFSLFREYIAQLFEYKKQFLILGNVNAVGYKNIFPHIKNNELWLGVSISGGSRKFNVPADYPLYGTNCGIDENGTRYIRISGVRWFTNMTNDKHNVPLTLTKHYNPEEYPKYDNYDVIEVGKTKDIPMDYDEVMGVPITFLDKYCPTQFEIIDARSVAFNEKQKSKSTYLIKDADGSINGKPTYVRICIKKLV